jgi:hypothetical protein
MYKSECTEFIERNFNRPGTAVSKLVWGAGTSIAISIPMKLLIFMLLLLLSVQAQAVSFKYADDVSATQRSAIDQALQDVLTMTPPAFTKGLPAVIKIKVKTYAGNLSIPEICTTTDPVKSKFQFGKYFFLDNSLTLNSVVVAELAKGPQGSKRIPCQHKSLYLQSIATIIHELAHAYDRNSSQPSESLEFKNIAGFKKFLFLETNKNSRPKRSMDDYEMKNPEEAFAVNMEYFVMDPEYACRRPTMHNYLKNLFGEDPHSNRSCAVNYTAVLTTPVGMIPTELDPSRVYRIDYLLASNGESMASGFGHSMFRIIVCAPKHINSITKVEVPATPFGKDCIKDRIFHVVPSFRANSSGAVLNNLKGLFGGYPSMLFMLPFQGVMEEYNNAELRDLKSYPLKLSVKEKKDFITLLLQEHWDYRGKYKFITNNCAVESLKTLNSILRSRSKIKETSILPTLTPNGVLKVLTDTGLVDLNDPEYEIFEADVKEQIASYRLAYQVKSANITKKDVMDFMLNSTPYWRSQSFKELESQKLDLDASKKSLSLLVSDIKRRASYSAIEQQVFRTKLKKINDKLADYISQNDKLETNNDLKYLLQKSSEKSGDVLAAAKDEGYGIPLSSEISFKFSLEDVKADLKEMSELSQNVMADLFVEESKELKKIEANLGYINKSNLAQRRKYRKLFEKYVITQIEELSRDDAGRSFLQEVVNGDVRSFREKLGKDIMTNKEITDQFIVNLIQQIAKL